MERIAAFASAAMPTVGFMTLPSSEGSTSMWMIFASRRELVGGARDPVVEAHPDGEKQVGAVYGPVDAGLPVHPRPAQVQRVVVGEGAYAEQRRHDRDARPAPRAA